LYKVKMLLVLIN